MTKNSDGTTSNRFEILDLDEPDEPAGGNETVEPPPDWDPNEPLIIDMDGRIHVRGGRFFTSRVVGRVRGESAEATIAALMNRFQELEDRFRALQREVKGSRNVVRSLKSAHSFVHWVEGADAIGDFPGLLERAQAVVDELEGKLESSRSAKLELIQRAEKLAESSSWSATGKAMDELMEAWKRTGSGGGDEDDALWERFRQARSLFYSRRSEHSADLRRSRGDARKTKEDLIAQSAELASSTDWDATFDAMQRIMDEWKLAGSAGRKQDDELWERFREVREPFFAARRQHFAEQRRPAPPADRGRAGDRRSPRGERRDRRPEPAAGGGRTRSTGTLHASLAEILGPMKDLFPAGENAKGQSESSPKDKNKRR